MAWASFNTRISVAHIKPSLFIHYNIPTVFKVIILKVKRFHIGARLFADGETYRSYSMTLEMHVKKIFSLFICKLYTKYLV